jgi:hypothetical protein
MDNKYSIYIDRQDWTHEIHFDKSDFGDYYIYCKQDDCKIRQMIDALAPKDWLWDLILDESGDDESGFFEGTFIFGCDGIIFERA